MIGLRLTATAVALAATLSVAMPASAQTVSTNDAVARLFTGEIDPAWLNETFAAAVPPDRLAALIEEMTSGYGSLVSVEGSGPNLSVQLTDAEVPTEVTLDAEGRISGLFFQAPIPTSGDVASESAGIANLPGETAILVTTDGEDVASHNADEPLMVGSTFKLAILAALMDAVDNGSIALDDVVPFDAGWRSAGSGTLHTWPEGSPVTIATLANLMIAISDNTATDALIDVVGRERIEPLTPRNTPLLKTAEVFKLNASGNAELAAAWRAADANARRAMLPEIDPLPLPAAGDLAPGPLIAEWHMTVREACALIERAADAPCAQH